MSDLPADSPYDATCVAMLALPAAILMALVIAVRGSAISMSILVTFLVGYIIFVATFLEFFYDIDPKYIMPRPRTGDTEEELLHGSIKLEEARALVLHRVVVDKISGEEVVVHGAPETTFRDAVQEYWGSSILGRHPKWSVYDERGEDISNEPLSSYDGVSFVLRYPT